MVIVFLQTNVISRAAGGRQTCTLVHSTWISRLTKIVYLPGPVPPNTNSKAKNTRTTKRLVDLASSHMLFSRIKTTRTKTNKMSNNSYTIYNLTYLIYVHIPHMLSYTIMYRHIPPYTSIYFHIRHIRRNTVIYIDILQIHLYTFNYFQISSNIQY